MSSHHNTQDSIDSVDSGSYYSNSESDTDHSTTHLIPGPHGHSRGSGRGTDSDTLAASSAESLGYVSGDERRYPAHLNNDFVYPPLPDSPAPRSALPHRTSHLAPPPTSILKSPRSPRFPGSPGIPPSPSARRGPPPSAYLKNISVLPPPDSPFLNSPYLPPGSPYSPKINSSRASVVSLNTGWVRRQNVKRGVKRKVKLTHGNFIAEYKVPTAILNAAEEVYKTGLGANEFTYMRYTAATCDPDDFTAENGWSLRHTLHTPKRETDILIAVTSYNEDKFLYSRTLHGVMLNVRDIVKSKSSKYWRKATNVEEGKRAWERITVALIVDGLEVMDKSVLDLLATVGVYQDGVMKKKVDGKDTVAHIFEYTTQLSVDTKPQLVLPQLNDQSNLVPVQIILVIKAKNQKKINSHRWLFNAIGRMLDPEVCVLIDAGTKPDRKALYYLWEAFYNDPNLGGCCGEIHAMLEGGRKLLNPLVAAQNFEYKMSNILDKPLESTFGYVSVLPGAFSAYRYRAIQGRPLEQYFHGDHSLALRLGDKGINGMSIFTKNMFLAEDRILCFELVAKKGAAWTLGYVQPSKAETDVPETIEELIGQRRRWLNGSFAASVYAVVNFWRALVSGVGVGAYTAMSLFFSWFALANLWLTFSIIIDLLPSQRIVFWNVVVIHWINATLKWIYICATALQFILALGNRPKSEKFAYTVTMWIYAVLAVYLLVCSLWLTSSSFATIPSVMEDASNAGEFLTALLMPPVGPLMAAMISTFGIYLTASIMCLDPWHMMHSFFPYLCLAPSFTNILNVYAFCNLHDVSWGTKGSDKSEALPSIKSKTSLGSDEPTVEDTTNTQEDIDLLFQDTVKRALNSTPPPAPKSTTLSSAAAAQKMDDDNRKFRTWLVASWLFTNAVLVVAVENIGGWLNVDEDGIDEDVIRSWEEQFGQKRNAYFAFILYATFGLAMVRFMGFLWYWLKRNVFRCCRRS
ncbi:hypothetical protein D9756_010015 [Leucocoprinus leucothites]|uniref:Chitin synthase n=1 Tax=Leucocoprinus leucothites TaxID=201217 RepID=A0A8H5CRG2_9AGAR|nr:hypothetical protein D9756_010015 [Leucoagaricus leucothites]